jgi:hypothetical protein
MSYGLMPMKVIMKAISYDSEGYSAGQGVVYRLNFLTDLKERK